MAPGLDWRGKRNSRSWRAFASICRMRLDGAWKIDVKKVSAQLPPPVRERLRRIIEPLGAAIKEGVPNPRPKAHRGEPHPRLE